MAGFQQAVKKILRLYQGLSYNYKAWMQKSKAIMGNT